MSVQLLIDMNLSVEWVAELSSQGWPAVHWSMIGDPRADDIDEYVSVIFDEYAQDRDLGALLASLRVVSRVKGVTSTAEAAGMTRKGLQKALSESGNPKFESLVSIMGAMGYRLAPRKVEMTTAD